MELGSDAAQPENITLMGLSFMYGNYGTTYEGNNTYTYAGENEGMNDDLIEVFMTTLSVRHYFGDGLSADFMLPTGMIQYDYFDSTHKHGETARASGLGDISLGVGYELGTLWGSGGYRPSLVGRLNLALPTGTHIDVGEHSHDADDPSSPMELGATPTLLALGLGTFAASARLEYTQFVHRMVALRVPLWARLPLHENEKGLLFGARMGYGLGVFVMATPELNFSTEISGVYGLRSHHSGEGEVLKSGGHWLAAEVGIGYRITDRVQVSLKGRLPLYTAPNGRQLTETFSLTGGLAIRFGDDAEEEGHDHSDHEEPGAHEHDAHKHDAHEHDAHEGHDKEEPEKHGDGEHVCPHHGKAGPGSGAETGAESGHTKHEHESGSGAGSDCGPDCNKPCCNKDKPEDGCGPDCKKPCCNKDAPKADVSDAATGGKSFVLKDVLVPGKVTVIDFWAEWCKPCKVIGKFLDEIAKDHPHLAVRKVELIDFDSPVAKEHLKGVPALPVVRIYDEKGRRVVNLVGAKPKRVRAEVLRILAKKQAP